MGSRETKEHIHCQKFMYSGAEAFLDIADPGDDIFSSPQPITNCNTHE